MDDTEEHKISATHVPRNVDTQISHVPLMMERHKAGGPEEREEVLAILYSLRDEVLSRSEES